jgi:hypothetical protein
VVLLAAVLICVGVAALGFLLGFGIAGIGLAKNVLIQVTGVLAGLLTAGVLGLVMRWYWRFGPAGVAYLALVGFVGAQVGALTHIAMIYHHPWWIYLLLIIVVGSDLRN